MRKRWFIGHGRLAGAVDLFASDSTPTEERYSGVYTIVTGPFRRKMDAICAAHHGMHNAFTSTAYRACASCSR